MDTPRTIAQLNVEHFRKLLEDRDRSGAKSHAAAQHMTVRGLIERASSATSYKLTDQGRAVLDVLLERRK